mmetsp:Transcript_681/g.2291  ORF Transcript_681/g.2291 Transcript_681/m.2291 type:complete len:97 (-) Transcript_681:320-610(-)
MWSPTGSESDAAEHEERNDRRGDSIDTVWCVPGLDDGGGHHGGLGRGNRAAPRADVQPLHDSRARVPEEEVARLDGALLLTNALRLEHLLCRDGMA